MSEQISSLLVANRGEIALRVIRTAREMAVSTVAVYGAQDRDAAFVEAADEAYLLGGDGCGAYLDSGPILAAAVRSGADAIHPGYGFLSERPDFAQAVLDAGLVWIGPSPKALDALGDKVSARRVADAAGVPVVPGTARGLTGPDDVARFVACHGYPVVMKRTDGGGGRGISVIRDDEDLRTFLQAHGSGDDLASYFAERFIPHARHVETQCGRDSHGGFVVYSTRDCSVQRRHQKLIEEAPAPFLDDDVVSRLSDWSHALFETVGYVGLGTCEFMVEPDGTAYFLEVNPRLQVEHTVSEEVCGLDLVREQIVIASGGSVCAPRHPRGHSIELRITSEDPRTGLTPGSGRIEDIRWPAGPGIRVDAGVRRGDVVSPAFDPMMGKLIVTAQNRSCAIARARRALEELRVVGVPTPVDLYRRILADPAFTGRDGRLGISTTWLESAYLGPSSADAVPAQAVWSPGVVSGEDGTNGSESGGSVPLSFPVEVDGRRMTVTLPKDVMGVLGQDAADVTPVDATPDRGRRRQPLRRSRRDAEGRPMESGVPTSSGMVPGAVAAPLQAVVVRMVVEAGSRVKEGDLLVVLEAMKMENYVRAPRDGIVAEVRADQGESVSAGDALVVLAAARTPDEATADGSADGKDRIRSGSGPVDASGFGEKEEAR
ncbi:biotin carboxylase N-terminal domain-containing protein [uncultured Bifidobacterium sp.]|uniref:ATP-binding protein n=1 Tax=uncultured Bifidobacterium sp. TaxID=165187 RepID=UPI0028DB512D|nr:biotin carboxylase N-terminal domain-containing protein [uncultured Bifidobacterium sp.]